MMQGWSIKKLQVIQLLKEEKSSEAFKLARIHIARAIDQKGEAHPEVLGTREELAACYYYSGQTRKALEENEPYILYQITTSGFENPELFNSISDRFKEKLELGGEAMQEAKSFLLNKVEEGKRMFAKSSRKSMSIQLCAVRIFFRSFWLVDVDGLDYEKELYDMAVILVDTAQENLTPDDVLRMRIEETWLRAALEIPVLTLAEKFKIADILYNKQAIVDVLLSSLLRNNDLGSCCSLCELLIDADRLAEAVTLFLRADTGPYQSLYFVWRLVGPVCTAILRKCSSSRRPGVEDIYGKLRNIASIEHGGQVEPYSWAWSGTATWAMIRFRAYIHLGDFSNAKLEWKSAQREYEQALGLVDWRATQEFYLRDIEQLTIGAVVKFVHAYAKNIATTNEAQGTDSISGEWLSSSLDDVGAARALFASVRLQLYSRRYLIIQLPKISIFRIPLHGKNLTASIVYKLFSLIRSEASKYSVRSSIFFAHFSTTGLAIIRFSGFFEPCPVLNEPLCSTTEAYARDTWKRLPQTIFEEEKGKSLRIVEMGGKQGNGLVSVSAEAEGSNKGEMGQVRESTALGGLFESFGFGPGTDVNMANPSDECGPAESEGSDQSSPDFQSLRAIPESILELIDSDHVFEKRDAKTEKMVEAMSIVRRTLWDLGDTKGSNIAYVL
jgi:tetratricopeptide (TPR) repeat protein